MKSVATSFLLAALLGAALVVPIPTARAQEEAKKAEKKAPAGADQRMGQMGMGQMGPMT